MPGPPTLDRAPRPSIVRPSALRLPTSSSRGLRATCQRARLGILGVLALGGAACDDEAHFHFLAPPGGSTFGGAPSAGGGAPRSGGAGPLGGEGGAAGAGGSGGSTAASLLLHRYDFEGEGTTAVDRVGDADGAILGGATLTGTGELLLDGVDDYVALPPRLVSHLPAVTFAAWLTWESEPSRCWQRIFDFGNNDAETPGDAGLATSSVFVTPSNCGAASQDPPHVLTAAREVVGSVQWVRTSSPLPVEEPAFVALVFSDVDERFELYLDGELVAGEGVRPAMSLADLDDTNDWLGRSQWIQDQGTFLRGRYDEFRIYRGALSPQELRELARRGPDAP